MKICQVSPGIHAIPEGKADVNSFVIHNLASRFARKGHEVDVIDISYEPRPRTIYRVHEIRIPMMFPMLREIVFTLSFLKLLKKRYDIIHFYGPLSAFLTSRLFPLNKMLTVYTGGSAWLSMLDQISSKSLLQLNVADDNKLLFISSFYIQSLAMRSVSSVIVPTNHIKRNLIEYLKVEPRSIKVLPYGVDAQRFTPGTPQKSLLDLYGQNPCVMCIGRISPYKNQLALLKTLPLVMKEIPAVIYVFIGPIKTQSYFNALHNFIESNKLEHNVVFEDLKEDLLPYYRLADVIVIPSMKGTEGQPLTLLEAMSCGKAIIAAPEMVEAARRGDEILLTDPDNTEQLASAIINVLSDRSLRIRLEEAARRTAVAYYDWDAVAETTLKFYEDLLNPTIRTAAL